MDALAILATLGSIAASMVGFAGLLTAFRSANESLQPNDINNIRILLIYSVSALVFALLPLPFAAGDAADGPLWRTLAVLLGVYFLFWLVQSPRWMKRNRVRPLHPALYASVLALQAMIGAAMIAGALMTGLAHALYVAGILWLLLTAIVVFVVQIFRMLPMKAPGAPD